MSLKDNNECKSKSATNMVQFHKSPPENGSWTNWLLLLLMWWLLLFKWGYIVSGDCVGISGEKAWTKTNHAVLEFKPKVGAGICFQVSRKLDRLLIIMQKHDEALKYRRSTTFGVFNCKSQLLYNSLFLFQVMIS